MATGHMTYIEKLEPTTLINFSEIVLICCLLDCCNTEGICDISDLQRIFNATSMQHSPNKKIGKFRMAVERLAGLNFLNVKCTKTMHIIQIVHYSESYAEALNNIVRPKLEVRSIA